MKELLLAIAVILSGVLYATPTSQFWTNCSTDVKGFKGVNIGVDSCFTVGKGGVLSGGQIFPVDAGITVGVLPSDTVKTLVKAAFKLGDAK